jgi:hypothetical protein
MIDDWMDQLLNEWFLGWNWLLDEWVNVLMDEWMSVSMDGLLTVLFSC